MSPQHLTTIQRIVGLVCARRQVTPGDIEGPSHSPQIVWARYLVLYLARRFTPLSYREIGLLFNRQGNGVWVALRTFETWCECYAERRREADELAAAIESGGAGALRAALGLPQAAHA